MRSCWACRSIPAPLRCVPAAVLLWATVGGCAAPPGSVAPPEPVAPPGSAAPRPIVLITLGGLRADTVGDKLPPRLAELAASADWTGTAIAASSDPLLSLTSLLTGTRPWQHQLLSSETPHRRPFPTLAALLRQAGYTSRAYVPEYLHAVLANDFDQRFDSPDDVRAAAALPPPGGREFVWLHFPHAELAHALAGQNSPRPRTLRRQLLRWADPAVALPPAERRRLLRDYRARVAQLDKILGAALEALRRGPAADGLVLAVAASNGQEFGEHGQILFGENLGRETIEVPLYLDLPPEIAARLAAAREHRVALPRLFTTLVEAAGAVAAPVHPPSLFRSRREPILSELYAKNGTHHFSLVDGDLQLHWTTVFAAPDPEYWAARQVRAGAPLEISRPPAHILGVERAELDHTLPLAGPPGSVPEWRLERWTGNATAKIEDPERARALAGELRRRFERFVDRERTPAEERRLEAPSVPPPS